MQPRAAVLVLALASLALAGCVSQPAAPGPGSGPGAGSASSTAMPLAFAAPYDFQVWGYEPSIAIDQQGVLYVTSHKVLDRPETWPYPGSQFELSRDGGLTWEFPASPTPGPLPLHQAYLGDEGDIAVDARGWVYYLDTYLGDNHLHAWSDGGRTWEYSQPVMKTALADDRPWITAQGEGLVHYLGNNGVPVDGGRHWYYRSDDGGLTFSPGQPVPGNGWAHIDAERSGATVYVVQEWAADNSVNAPGPQRAIVSRDGGLTWGPPITILEREGNGRGYPVVSAGEGGVAWALMNDCGAAENCPDQGGAQEPNQLMLARTADHGATWQAWNLTLPEGIFADYPWVAAGPNGTVAVVFYGAQAPVGEASEWHLYAAMARPGTQAAPDLVFQRAVEQPVYVGADLHALHDFFEVAIAPDEAVHIAYMTVEDSADPVHDYGERFVFHVRGHAPP
jgi:hypothetical protein